MLTKQRVITILVLVVVAIGPVIAQDAQQRVDPAATPSVTAAASGSDLRFTAPESVVQMRLEVFSPEGEKVFDSGDKPGNLLDWRIPEQPAALNAESSYLCTVTVRDFSNRLSQRRGIIGLSGGRVILLTAERDHLTPAQVHAWEASRLAQAVVGPAQDGDAFTILAADVAPASTVATHDGQDGQVTSTAGALTFRTGDIFSGREKEQLRITPEGRVGIGTSTPKATLDIAGTLRARGGIKFDDGSVLTSSGRVARAGTGDDDTPTPLVAGTGSTNRVTKWTNGPAGTLGDSALSEVGGKLGLGTANPNFELTLFGSDVGVQMISPATGAAMGDGFRFGITSTNNAFLFNQEATDMFFATSAIERIRIKANGNVGIGTSSPNPATKLDVLGDINTSTQYRIGGNRVFSIAGPGNTFAGFEAGLANTTGIGNSFFGSLAGSRNTTAFGNSFFGVASGQNNTTGSSNSFFGNGAGLANATGAENSFFGASAGLSNTTGNSNAFFGKSAGLSNTTGSSNAFFGASAGAANTTGGGNSFFGDSAGSSNTASSNSFFGQRAGTTNTTGFSNSFFGSNAGGANTGGDFNSFFGAGAGSANTTGSSNSFVGRTAGSSNTTGNNNSFFGSRNGISNTTGGENAFFGSFAGTSNTTGGDNSFFGNGAGGNNTTAASNSFFGSNAGASNATGGGNSFFGRGAGNANTTGSRNIVIGLSAGGNLTTGNDNIYLATSPGANESNAIRIGTGGTQTAAFIAGINGSGVSAASGTTVFVDAGGRLGTILSSSRFKQNIRTMGDASGKLMQLRPVTFLYKPEVVPGEQTLQYGLIAEEVAKIYPDLVQYVADGKPQTVRYHLLNTMLLNEVQKQQSHIQSQAHQIQTQTEQMIRQERQITDLETRLRRLETKTSRRQRGRR